MEGIERLVIQVGNGHRATPATKRSSCDPNWHKI
jgi:hypothetical protein